MSSTFSPDVLALNPELALALKIHEREYKSKLEEKTAKEWIPKVNPLTWYYEPMILHLPSGNYTPDFMLILEDRTILMVEVKGWNKNLRADRRKFKEAVKTFPCFRWCWLTWKGGEWKAEYYYGDSHFSGEAQEVTNG